MTIHFLTMAEIKQNQVAWTEGYQAPKGAICPYEPGTDKAFSWASGQVEGLARRNRKWGPV